MDFFQAQDFFAQMYPNKKISYEFDDTCHRTIELVHTDGKPNIMHHVECNKVKVNVEGMDSIYCPIQAHRFNTTWAAAKNYVNKKTDVHIHEDEIKNLKELKEKNDADYEAKLTELCEYSGLSKDQIEAKC